MFLCTVMYSLFTVLLTLSLSQRGHCYGHQPRQVASSIASINQSTWNAFNATVSGHLHNGEPMMAPCYTDYDGVLKYPDVAECFVLQSARSDTVLVSDYFGGYINVNWGSCQTTGQSCALSSLLNPDTITPVTRECYQGSVPSKYVNVQSVKDVQNTFSFVQENNLRLVIKNTGHDYKGRSSAPDSIALWMHNYQPDIVLETSFTPDGCSAAVGDVITFGAGQEFEGIYEFAHSHNYRVVGGSSSSVGAAGGWITGGGHSMLSNELGLGVDNVQQLRAVLPNGTYVTANRCQNQDVFFALRGGGGGSFAVIMEMSTLAHPESTTQVAEVTFASLSAANAAEFISLLVANADTWASQGWGGYIQPSLVGSQVSSFIMATSLLNHTEAVISMQPVLTFVSRFGTLANASVTTFDTYFDVLASLTSTGLSAVPAGAVAISSRIVPRESFLGLKNQTELSTILNSIIATNEVENLVSIVPLFICVTAPTVYSQNLPTTDLPGSSGAASVTPSWRTGLWHVIHLRVFDGTTTEPAIVNAIWQAAHDTMDPLRAFTPNSGAYLNEADPFETDPISTFWGADNYNRLLSIKREIDPNNILTVHQGVGWDDTDDRYNCYPDVIA